MIESPEDLFADESLRGEDVMETQSCHVTQQSHSKYPTYPQQISRENYNSKRYMHPYVYGSTTDNSQDMEAI